MKKKIAIKATPHKINKHALCNTAQSISKRTYLCEAPFCVHKAEAIPHKDCATDASSNFPSDETKSGVNT
jgi:hypothetical protein